MKTKRIVSSAAAIALIALSVSGAAIAQGAGGGGGGGAAGAEGGAVGTSRGGSMDDSATMGTTATPASTPKKHRWQHSKSSANTTITKDPNSTHMLGVHQGGAAITSGKDSLSGGESGASGGGSSGGK